MKKFLIYSLFTVALIVFGAIIFLKIKSEPKPTIVSENGDELAKAMQTTLDVSAWDSLHFLHWSFRGDTEYTWDKVQNLVVVKWDGNQVNLTLDKVEGIAFSDGIQAGKWKTKWLVRKAWKKWCNDSYWMFAPFKVFDPGTRRTIAKLPDGTQGLWVEYLTGGVTPGDGYFWILDADKKPKAFKMWVSIIPLKGVEASWENWVELSGGAWLSTAHGFDVFGKKISTEMLDVRQGVSWGDFGFDDQIEFL